MTSVKIPDWYWIYFLLSNLCLRWDIQMNLCSEKSQFYSFGTNDKHTIFFIDLKNFDTNFIAYKLTTKKDCANFFQSSALEKKLNSVFSIQTTLLVSFVKKFQR